jgi:hypothetical protein
MRCVADSEEAGAQGYRADRALFSPKQERIMLFAGKQMECKIT